MILLLTLLFCSNSQRYHTDGISATVAYQDPAFLIQTITMSSSNFGISYFENNLEQYIIQFALRKKVPNVLLHGIVTSGYAFESLMSASYGYQLSSILTNDSSAALIKLQLFYDTQMSLLKLNLIAIGSALQTPYPFAALLQRTVTAPNSFEYFVPHDIQNTKILPFLKHVRLELNGSTPNPSQSLGFKFLSGTPDGTNYGVGFQLSNSCLNCTVNVTFTLLAYIPVLYTSLTSQFVNLKFYATEGLAVTPTSQVLLMEPNQKFPSSLIIGQNSFIGLKQHSRFNYQLGVKNITFEANGIEEYNYLAVQVINYQCDPSHPYRFKNDSNCFSCPKNQILINTNPALIQHTSTVQIGQCIKVNTTLSGYSYNQQMIKSICACCRLCKQTSYLEDCVCYLCKQKINGCLQCNSNGTSCTKCQANFSLIDTDNDTLTLNSICQSINQTQVLCKQKINGCLQCNSNGTSCTKCQANFSLIDTGNDTLTLNSICSQINKKNQTTINQTIQTQTIANQSTTNQTTQTQTNENQSIAIQTSQSGVNIEEKSKFPLILGIVVGISVPLISAIILIRKCFRVNNPDDQRVKPITDLRGQFKPLPVPDLNLIDRRFRFIRF